jgi:hypothetical protein
MILPISSNKKEIDMNTKNTLNTSIAIYLLIALGLVWVSLMIRWSVLRIATVACAGILLSGQLKIRKKGVNHGLGDSNT